MKPSTSHIPRFLTFVFVMQTGLHAKDVSAGPSLWLSDHAPAPDLKKEWSAVVRQVFHPVSSAIALNARDELLVAAGKLTGREVSLAES
jgi:hypothetical protein